jgi:hypothetical protein
LADPDLRVRANALDMANVAKAIDAFDAKRGTE